MHRFGWQDGRAWLSEPAAASLFSQPPTANRLHLAALPRQVAIAPRAALEAFPSNLRARRVSLTVLDVIVHGH
jgi:hypothetical protein